MSRWESERKREEKQTTKHKDDSSGIPYGYDSIIVIVGANTNCISVAHNGTATTVMYVCSVKYFLPAVENAYQITQQ